MSYGVYFLGKFGENWPGFNCAALSMQYDIHELNCIWKILYRQFSHFYVFPLQAILRFWLDKGVDGFRVNAPAYLFEDSGQRDEAVIPGCADTVSRDHFVYAPSQWETVLHCKVVSHWLGAYTKWSPRKLTRICLCLCSKLEARG